ncbi:Crp/Fnr family transcriptional regulator [Oryzifoliimicrobium ureilyticus]|uniref:Crp/Fnr family transcriptional regulator n=1 Tax=Oryzifoliimicrobium ureilyticus TaxID=3113724 RepID=UPI0030761D70
MAIPHQSSMSNKLLAILPEADYREVAKDLEYVALPRGAVLGQTDKPIDYIYFITSGIGSVMIRTPEGNRAEAGLFGFEGYAPTSAIGEVRTSPHDVAMQMDGGAYRMHFDAFRTNIERFRSLFRIVVRAMEAFNIQVSYTAASNAVHDVNVRLARWLLMCHDRVPSNELALTHDFLSVMLTVRRPSVTTSLHVLEGNGFIKAQRGNITIRNRRALEEFAHDAYGRPEEEYRRLMQDLF